MVVVKGSGAGTAITTNQRLIGDKRVVLTQFCAALLRAFRLTMLKLYVVISCSTSTAGVRGGGGHDAAAALAVHAGGHAGACRRRAARRMPGEAAGCGRRRRVSLWCHLHWDLFFLLPLLHELSTFKLAHIVNVIAKSHDK